jgi:uncharacterized membrane-anchored protein
MTNLPVNHPQRMALNDEVHARPPESLTTPLRLTCLAIVADLSAHQTQLDQLSELARYFGVEPPQSSTTHYSADFGSFRLNWERHTEFARYTIIVAGVNENDLFAAPATDSIPADFLQALPGQLIAATHAVFVEDGPPYSEAKTLAARYFDSNVLIGAEVAGGRGRSFTDFRIRSNGAGRLLVCNRGMTGRQAGRTLQRLFEIETYRMMALLALPVARDLAPRLTILEEELVAVTEALIATTEMDEPMLLERLAGIESQIENKISATEYRFSAASAYANLVKQRIVDLREERIEGLQTFLEFTERRMVPAMRTCRSVADRLSSLSERVARATEMLATRIDVSRERQNQALLKSMDRRASMQLRLQETVEGLSVVAISYYSVGLLSYAVKGLKAAGLHLDSEIVNALAIPIVILITAIGMKRIHRMAKQPDG